MLVRQASKLVSVIDYIQYNDRLAYVILFGIVGMFFCVEFHEIYEYENVYGAYENVASKIFANCSYDSIPFGRGPLNWYTICLGNLTFGTPRLMPLIISSLIILATFLLIRKYSNNFTAILVSSALCLDLTFLIFDSLPAFGQTWVLFFILSAYFIRKNHVLSGVFFWLACLSKILTISWLPILVWMALKTERNKKANLASMLTIIPAFLVSIFYFQGWAFYSGFPFVLDPTWERLESTFDWFVTAFRWEWHLVVSIPVLVSYYIFNKIKCNKISITPYLTALSAVAIVLLVPMFTNEGYFPYRLIPNIIMIFYACAYTINHALNYKTLKRNNPVKNN